jgi:polar amino acid transport system permease protein
MAFETRYVIQALPFLIRGAGLTLEVSVFAIALGLVVGILLTLVREARIQILDVLAATYISLMRGTPLFIQILIVYFGLSAVGVDLSRFYAGVIALSLNSGAYITEMIRGGLTAIHPGQRDAATALGMPNRYIWGHILLPQVLFLILPPLTIEFTGLLKASALLSVIGVVELTRTAQQIIIGTFRPVEVWLTTAVLYFVMCFALGAVTRRLERVAAAYRS